MILNIVLVAVAIVAGTVLLLAVTPIGAVLEASYLNRRFRGGCIISFFHPCIVSVSVDFLTRDFRVCLFGRKVYPRRKKDIPREERLPEEKAEEVAGEETPEIFPGIFSGEQPEAASSDRGEMASPEAGGGEAEAPVGDRKDESGDSGIREAEPEERLLTDSTVQPADDVPRARHHVSTAPSSEEEPGVFSDETGTLPAEERKQDEPLESQPEKKDNWFVRLERNRYLFFLRNRRWRGKILRWSIRFFRVLFLIVRFDRLRLRVRAGINDPAMVGTVFGMYTAVRNGLPMKRPYVIRFEPVFMTRICEGSAGFRVTTSILRVLSPVLFAVVTFPWLHTAWLVWRVYRREKRFGKRVTAS